MSSALTLAHVTAGYGGRAILNDLSLTIAPGELVGIVGPSGSGKTTLLRLIAGRVERYAGAVTVAGRDAGTVRSRVGYVPQLDGTDWDFPLSVLQTVLLGAAADSRRRPWFSRAERRRALSLLERLGLHGVHARHLRELSGGQQRRVFVARALMRRPELLLCDEPTGGVDLGTRHELLRLLGDLNDDGLTVLLTTHDLNWVAAHLPRIVCLNGTVIADGPPTETITEDTLLATYGSPMRVLRDGPTVVVADHASILDPAREETPAPVQPWS